MSLATHNYVIRLFGPLPGDAVSKILELGADSESLEAAAMKLGQSEEAFGAGLACPAAKIALAMETLKQESSAA